MKLREIAATIEVPLAKIRDYALNPGHHRGKDKAVLFARLGYTQVDAAMLRQVILDAAPDAEATFQFEDHYGARYYADVDHIGPTGLKAVIRTAWIRPVDTDVVRLTSLGKGAGRCKLKNSMLLNC